MIGDFFNLNLIKNEINTIGEHFKIKKLNQFDEEESEELCLAYSGLYFDRENNTNDKVKILLIN